MNRNFEPIAVLLIVLILMPVEGCVSGPPASRISEPGGIPDMPQLAGDSLSHPASVYITYPGF